MQGSGGIVGDAHVCGVGFGGASDKREDAGKKRRIKPEENVWCFHDDNMFSVEANIQNVIYYYDKIHDSSDVDAPLGCLHGCCADLLGYFIGCVLVFHDCIRCHAVGVKGHVGREPKDVVGSEFVVERECGKVVKGTVFASMFHNDACLIKVNVGMAAQLVDCHLVDEDGTGALWGEEEEACECVGQVFYFRELVERGEVAELGAIMYDLSCAVGADAGHFLQQGGVGGVEVDLLPVGEFVRMFFSGVGFDGG